MIWGHSLHETFVHIQNVTKHMQLAWRSFSLIPLLWRSIGQLILLLKQTLTQDTLIHNSPHLFQSGPRRSPRPLFLSPSPPSVCILILLAGRCCRLPAFGVSLAPLSPYHGCQETSWISRNSPAVVTVSRKERIRQISTVKYQLSVRLPRSLSLQLIIYLDAVELSVEHTLHVLRPRTIESMRIIACASKEGSL